MGRSLISFLAVTLVACGGGRDSGNPTGPSPSVGPTISSCTTMNCPPINSIGVQLRTFGTAPYSYTFANHTRSGSGESLTSFENVTPGEWEVAGQVGPGVSFGIGRMGSSAPGGIVENSIQSLEGPGPVLQSCSIIYQGVPSGGMASFRFRFTVSLTRSAGGNSPRGC